MGTSLQVLVPAVLHLKERKGREKVNLRVGDLLSQISRLLLFLFGLSKRNEEMIFDSPVLGEVHRNRKVGEIVQSSLPPTQSNVSAPVEGKKVSRGTKRGSKKRETNNS